MEHIRDVEGEGEGMRRMIERLSRERGNGWRSERSLLEQWRREEGRGWVLIQREGGGRPHLLLALVISPLTTHGGGTTHSEREAAFDSIEHRAKLNSHRTNSRGSIYHAQPPPLTSGAT